MVKNENQSNSTDAVDTEHDLIIRCPGCGTGDNLEPVYTDDGLQRVCPNCVPYLRVDGDSTITGP